MGDVYVLASEISKSGKPERVSRCPRTGRVRCLGCVICLHVAVERCRGVWTQTLGGSWWLLCTYYLVLQPLIHATCIYSMYELIRVIVG